jgi:hypothetical protein
VTRVVVDPTVDEAAVLREYTHGWALDLFLRDPARAVEHFRGSLWASGLGGRIGFQTRHDGIHAQVVRRAVVLPWSRVLQVIRAQAGTAGPAAVHRVNFARAAVRAHDDTRPTVTFVSHYGLTEQELADANQRRDREHAAIAAHDQAGAALRREESAAPEAFWDATPEPGDLLDLLAQLTQGAE